MPLAQPWRSYFTLQAITRTKSTAQVMYEAAEEDAASCAGGEDDGNGGLTVAKHGGMAKVLTVWDVIAYGIGSTLGAGIFAITGSGAHAAGPAIVLSFCVAATACLFSAFSYMEFAARVPIAGSAYTFTYVCLGELAAWFVGWNLTLEYMISAAVIARTWSSNLMLFINQIGGNYPKWLSSTEVEWGVISELSPMSAVICLLCTGILLMGVKESARFNMFITIVNICVILFVIGLGSFHVHTDNWTSPRNDEGPRTYFPMGINGVLTGAATVFFSYIGFDCVTTLSEEVKNAKRDVPVGIFVTLVVSTLLYVATSIVITGMQPWWKLDTSAPLAIAFNHAGVPWAATLISAATVTALTGNTLTSLFGQPRIFYRMAKDGLLFKPFAYLHPRTAVPLWGTVVTGVGAALIAFFIPLHSLADMISIGTLLAFSTVCAGVVILRYEKTMPAVDAGRNVDQRSLLQSVVAHDGGDGHAHGHSDAYTPLAADINAAAPYSSSSHHSDLNDAAAAPSLFSRLRTSATFLLLVYLIPCIGFCASLRHTSTCPLWIIILLGLACIPPVILIWRLPVCAHNLPKEGNFICPLVPFLPCAGIFTNCYLITSLDIESYVRIVVWTFLGFTIYFLYGIMHSTLSAKMAAYEAAMAADLQKDGLNLDPEHSVVSSASGSGEGHDAPLLAHQGPTSYPVLVHGVLTNVASPTRR